MKITAEFDSNEELLSFISTFGTKTVSQIIKGASSPKVEATKKEVKEDMELTKPVQLHSPDAPPIAQAAPIQQVPPAPTQQPVTPVQTPPPIQPVQQPIIPQQPVTPQLIQQQVPQQTPQQIAPTVAPVQTATQNYTENQLALAASQLIDSGRIKEVQQLLASFGIQALIHLPKEQYGAFATQLRGLGAKI